MLVGLRTYQYVAANLLLIVSSIVGHTCENELENQSERYSGTCHIENNKWVESVDKWEASKVGKCLISLPLGMNLIEKTFDFSNHILIGVHGFGSSGGEWITPFLTLNRDDLDIFFFRWEVRNNYNKAQESFITDLETVINRRKSSNPSITIIGHSCGGVLIASLLNKLNYSNQVNIHLVASPLRGMGLFTVCKAKNQQNFSDGIKLTQWRTHQRTDEIFSIFPLNPQVAKLGGDVIQLPRSMEGKRIGHVRALEIVANELKLRYTEEQSL